MITDPQHFSFTVEVASTRLDHYLVQQLPELSRSRIQALISEGHCSVNDVTVLDTSHKAKIGARIALHIPAPREMHINASDIPLDVVFEDEHLLVINKPAGLTVHPAAGHYDDTLVNALLAHCGKSLSGIGGVMRPGIVHRLDKDTSGLLVVAKHDEAHQHLSKQLQARTMKRHYIAIVWGVPKLTVGTIKGAIGRSQVNRKKMAVVKKDGREATTHYKVLETYPYKSLLIASKVECILDTGRTHQIRVHMSHNGTSLVGDPLYGSPPQKNRFPHDWARNFPRQALHAKILRFIHPINGQALDFESDLPPDMNQLINSLTLLKSE